MKLSKHREVLYAGEEAILSAWPKVIRVAGAVAHGIFYALCLVLGLILFLCGVWIINAIYLLYP